MKDEAWKATQIAFLRRFTAPIDYPIRYQGEFDYQQCAQSVTVPTEAKYMAHAEAWGELRRNFEAMWRGA